MGYHIDWAVKRHVIHLRFWGNLNATELRTAYDALVIHYQQGDVPLYLLLDHTAINQYPIGLNTYDFVIGGEPATKFTSVLIVGPNRQMRFLVRLFARVRHVESVAFDTEQEALAFLYQHNAIPQDVNVN